MSIKKDNTIIRVKKGERPYVVLDKCFINDPRLSARAVGIMTRLLSHTDNWKIYASYLYNNFPDGRDAIYNTFKELRKFGYMELVIFRDEKGKFKKREYYLYEVSTKTDDPLYDPDGAPVTRKAKAARKKKEPVTGSFTNYSIYQAYYVNW